MKCVFGILIINFEIIGNIKSKKKKHIGVKKMPYLSKKMGNCDHIWLDFESVTLIFCDHLLNPL